MKKCISYLHFNGKLLKMPGNIFVKSFPVFLMIRYISAVVNLIKNNDTLYRLKSTSVVSLMR